MNQLLRLLLLAPAAFSSLLSLVMARPAHAESAGWVRVSKDASCLRAVSRTTTQFTCKRVASAGTTAKVIDITKADMVSYQTAEPDDPNATTFEMTEEESNVTAALFGCDCPACVRSLRQLRSMLS
jgi:hypothetical protein